MFKLWGVGDITEKGLGEQNFTHLEAPTGKDVNNHITLQRVMRNFYEIQKDTYEILRDILKNSATEKGVFKNGDFDFEVIPISSVNYIRIKPGIAFTGEKIFVNRPLVHNASRQLETILKLRTSAIESHREYVEISYNGIFFATIKHNNSEKTYNNSGVGYNTGIALLEAIQADFPTLLGSIDLTNIKLEPMFPVGSGGYFGISNNGEFYYTSTSGDFDLYEIDSSGNIISEERIYYNKFNEFSGEIFLNKKPPLNNENVSITIRRDLDGNATIMWNESEKQFKINKNLKLINGDVIGSLTGDVIGDLTGNVNGNLTGNVNGLIITDVDNKNLNLENASLTVGEPDKNGDITITSDNASPKKITVNEDTTLPGGTLINRDFIKSQQHVVTIASESNTINIPSGFNKTNDTMIVFENLVYFLEKGDDKDYTINEAGNKIVKGDGYPGDTFPAGKYVFLILKNIKPE